LTLTTPCLSQSRAPYRTTFEFFLCVALKNFFRRDTYRFLSEAGHTCHARLLAFVSRLTNGPPHMARRARLRPDFGPAASPFRPRPATPTVSCFVAASRRIRVSYYDIVNEYLAIILFIPRRNIIATTDS
jgi:hypothetical protein